MSYVYNKHNYTQNPAEQVTHGVISTNNSAILKHYFTCISVVHIYTDLQFHLLS